MTRRRALRLGAGSAVAMVGLGAATGTTAAWSRSIADFRGCSEVWLVVDESDLPNGEHYPDHYPDHLEVRVLVADGSEVDCRPVPITPEKATWIRGHYDNPVVKYRVGRDEKILGVLWLNPVMNPHSLSVNDRFHCARTPGTPSVYEADCVPADIDPESADPDDGPGSATGRDAGGGRNGLGWVVRRLSSGAGGDS